MMDHKSVSLADQIFDRLEQEILCGNYPKGSILTESRLSEELGVSRTPIREALRRLEQEHIIESRSKGLLVLGISADDADYIYEIRLRVEGLAAAAAADNVSDEEIEALKETVDLQDFYAKRGDYERVKELDSRFHRQIYNAAGTAVFYDVLAPLHKKIQKFRKASVEDPGRAADSAKEHREILDAIVKRDAALAEKTMCSHVLSAKEHLISMLEKKRQKEDGLDGTN